MSALHFAACSRSLVLLVLMIPSIWKTLIILLFDYDRKFSLVSWASSSVPGDSKES